MRRAFKTFNASWNPTSIKMHRCLHMRLMRRLLLFWTQLSTKMLSPAKFSMITKTPICDLALLFKTLMSGNRADILFSIKTRQITWPASSLCQYSWVYHLNLKQTFSLTTGFWDFVCLWCFLGFPRELSLIHLYFLFVIYCLI